MKHVRYLAEDIGPRAPTSRAEARAAGYAADVLRGSGLDARIEPFHGIRSFGHIYLPIVAAMAIDALWAWRRKASRPFGLALGIAALGCTWGENTARFRPVSRAIAAGPSQNVVAVLPARVEARRKLVLVAHLDSSRSGLMFSRSMAPSFRRNALIGMTASFAMTLGWLLPTKLRRVVAAMSASPIFAHFASLIEREVRGKDVHGANDNASGAAVVLSLAAHLSASGLDHTEVWFVLTGCEESDRIGMQAFMDRNAKDLEDAWFIGFDTVGGRDTDVTWVTSSGLIEELKADRYLADLCARVAARNPDLAARPGTWRSAGLDTDIPAVRGLPVICLMALAQNGTLPDWHERTDTIEHLDPSAVERCLHFTMELVSAFDAGS